MPRTALTVVALPTPYVTTGPVDPGLTAGDVANGNDFTLTGDEIVIVRNVNVAAKTITITSFSSPITGRVGHITAFSIPAAGIRVFQKFTVAGWRQADGKLYIDVEHADVEIAVVRIP